jgi:hypothetical protein
MEYLDESGEVLQRDTHSSLLDAYLRYCRDNGLVPADLGGAASGLAGPGPSSSAARSRSGS